MTTPATRHDWVLAAPFRAHLHQVRAVTGLPWEVIACAAGVSPTLVRHLIYGDNGRFARRISPLTARRLAELTPARLPRVRSLAVTRDGLAVADATALRPEPEPSRA